MSQRYQVPVISQTMSESDLYNIICFTYANRCPSFAPCSWGPLYPVAWNLVTKY